MPFYHDEKNRTVISAPDTPMVQENKGKRGESRGWTVTAKLEITRADNYTNPKNPHQWMYPVSDNPYSDYDSRDSRESAIRYFKTFKYPKLPEISAEEYRRLRAKYDALAQSNQPPAS